MGAKAKGLAALLERGRFAFVIVVKGAQSINGIETERKSPQTSNLVLVNEDDIGDSIEAPNG